MYEYVKSMPNTFPNTPAGKLQAQRKIAALSNAQADHAYAIELEQEAKALKASE